MCTSCTFWHLLRWCTAATHSRRACLVFAVVFRPSWTPHSEAEVHYEVWDGSVDAVPDGVAQGHRAQGTHNRGRPCGRVGHCGAGFDPGSGMFPLARGGLVMSPMIIVRAGIGDGLVHQVARTHTPTFTYSHSPALSCTRCMGKHVFRLSASQPATLLYLQCLRCTGCAGGGSVAKPGWV
jgi:hypothetical protein